MNRSILSAVVAGALLAHPAAGATAGAASATTPASATAFHTRKVAVMIYPGVEVLDFTGPCEVFAAAGAQGAIRSTRAFEVFTVAATRDPIVSQGFLDVVPDYAVTDCPQPDVLVLPGGMSANVMNDKAAMDWIRSVVPTAECVITVCTGAFIAGEAGLLDGVDATTHFASLAGLAKRYPQCHVVPGKRFADSGKLVTTAGVSAGIDGSLHVVARLLGRYAADRTAEYMEYRWTPESYLSTQYSLLNPGLDARGRELQSAAILLREGNPGAAVEKYQQLTREDAADTEAWLGLGSSLHALGRFDAAIAAHREAAKGSAQRSTALYNIACEYALLGRHDEAIRAATAAVEAGFRGRWSFEHDEDLAAVRDDPRFQKLVAGL